MNTFWALVAIVVFAYCAATVHATEKEQKLEYTQEELGTYTRGIYNQGWDDAVDTIRTYCLSREPQQIELHVTDKDTVVIECKVVTQEM